MTDDEIITRILDLAHDWNRYGKLEPQWRDEMRRAIVVEMRVEVDKLAKACQLR